MNDIIQLSNHEYVKTILLYSLIFNNIYNCKFLYGKIMYNIIKSN